MKKLRAKKIGPGYYEVPTPHGTYRVENTPSPKGSGYGSGPNWLIIGPGQDVADASKPTKREAMEYIHYLCTADPDYKPEALPTLEDVELPSDEADREQARQEAKPRHTVDRLGDGYFAVIDNVTGLYHRVSSNRERAQKRADELNAKTEEPKKDPEPSLDDYAKASRIIQSLIPRGCR